MQKSNIIEFPQYSTLIIPGYQGSGPKHWQSWFERELPDARQVCGIDWATPHLECWVDSIRIAIRYATNPVWLVAHSFGCLAAVAAANSMAAQIAGALLVTPDDPDRFSRQGLRTADAPSDTASIASELPQDLLGFPTLLLSSSDDPWMTPASARYWADRWGSTVIDIGKVGHVDEDSGFGPWPEGLALFRDFQNARVNTWAATTRIAAEESDAAMRTWPNPDTELGTAHWASHH